METEQKSFIEKINSKWVTPFFAIVAVVYGFVFKVYSDQVDKNTQSLKNLQTQIDTELRQKEFENNLKLTIYKEVKEAVKAQNDTTLQNATLIVVNEMLKDDSAFREKLKTVLFSSSNSTRLISVQQRIDDFANEQKTAAGYNFKIDVFYLDDAAEAVKQKAQQVVNLLQGQYTNSQVRLRVLPKEVNAQSGYRININQIRYEIAETSIANDVLKTIADKKILEEPAQLHITTFPTPKYISVFVANP